ncbi:hypothetical protein EDB89DRAFT_1910415, partial [Lactarius sanguifluus]
MTRNRGPGDRECRAGCRLMLVVRATSPTQAPLRFIHYQIYPSSLKEKASTERGLPCSYLQKTFPSRPTVAQGTPSSCGMDRETCSSFYREHTSSTFVFETNELDICQDVAGGDSSSYMGGSRVDLELPRREGKKSGVFSDSSPLVTRHAHDGPSGSSNDQSDNGLTPATSYDDVPDSMPTDDFAEEELGSYDDDFGYTPAPPKGKGKAKAPARARIESDDDDEDDDDGRAEDAAARGPGWFVPYPVQSAAIKADPSFSILPLSPPKRVGVPATSPQRLSVHGGLFSPRVKSGVNNFAPAPVLSDEEQVEVRSPVKPLRKPVQLVPDSSPLTDGTPKEPAAPTPAALKTPSTNVRYLPSPYLNLLVPADLICKLDPPQPKFNPQLKVPAQFAAAPASTTSSAPAPAQAPAKAAPPFDKILITIRHPPTEKENKFKVKSTHLVGRVLTSACSAFGLNPTG